MFLKRTSFAIQAPQVHTEGSAVGETLFRKGVDDERVVAVPAVESWTGAHESDHCMGRVVGDTEDLLLDLGGWDFKTCQKPLLPLDLGMHDGMESHTPNADKVGDILEVGETRPVGDTALDTKILDGARLGESGLSIAEVRCRRLRADRINP